MNDIQKARDVLAKWRKGVVVITSIDDLIEGTAGNPDMLDAIDLMLDAGSRYWEGNPIRQHAQRIAAAIISAEERMSA